MGLESPFARRAQPAPQPCLYRFALAAALLAPVYSASADDPRMDALEQRLNQLSERVEVLEQLKRPADVPSATATKAKSGEVSWHFGDYLQGSPFSVLQHEFDRASGQVDLLLDVTGVIPDAGRWQGVVPGDAVPIRLIARLADSSTTPPIAFELNRGARFEAGSRLHVMAWLDPVTASGARMLQIEHVEPKDRGANTP